MYLPELFHKKIEEGASPVRALSACDEELKKRLGGRFDTQSILDHFFRGKNGECEERIEELMDFWNVYREYDAQVSGREKEERGILILNCIYEVDGIRHCDRCQQLILDWSGAQKERLDALCNLLEEGHIHHSKYISFLEERRGSWKEISRIPLKEYLRIPATFCYYAVRHQLTEAMEAGGLAVIVAGSPGLTPRRLFGIMLGERNYRLCQTEELEPVREQVLADPVCPRIWTYPVGESPLPLLPD